MIKKLFFLDMRTKLCKYNCEHFFCWAYNIDHNCCQDYLAIFNWASNNILHSSMQRFKENLLRPCPCCFAPASPRRSAAAAPPSVGRPPRPAKPLGPPRLCRYSGGKAYQIATSGIMNHVVTVSYAYPRNPSPVGNHFFVHLGIWPKLHSTVMAPRDVI